MFEAAKRWIAWVPGGLAVSTVFATSGFAAVSGASVATAAVFARIATELKIGCNKKFAAGVVAAGGTLASLIPPSAILVIYAIIVEQDVGKLLPMVYLFFSCLRGINRLHSLLFQKCWTTSKWIYVERAL